MAKLFAYFQRRGAWKGTEYEDEADYTHFSSEKKVDYEMARYTLVSEEIDSLAWLRVGLIGQA